MAGCVDGSCEVRHLTREEKRSEYDLENTKASDTRENIRNDLIRIGIHYCDGTADDATVEEWLHDAWDLLIHAGMITPTVSSDHDGLVTLVLEIREMGYLPKQQERTVANPIPADKQLVGRRLWSGLPLLARDMHVFWTEESMHVSNSQRKNLATLSAKLCASGVCAGEMARCALWLFREALETKRPLTPASSEGAISQNSPLSLADFLPACVEWLVHANFKLGKMSVEGWRPAPCDLDKRDDDEALASPGPLAKQAAVAQDGFSLPRWLFWRRHLGELYLHGGEDISPVARKGFEAMVNTGRALGLQIPGEQKYLERLFEALEKELVVRGSQGCVGAEDIEISPAWANEE